MKTLHSFANPGSPNLRQNKYSCQGLGGPRRYFRSIWQPLIPVIMARIPGEFAVQIALKTKNGVWSIKEILETVKAEVEAREIG